MRLSQYDNFMVLHNHNSNDDNYSYVWPITELKQKSCNIGLTVQFSNIKDSVLTDTKFDKKLVKQMYTVWRSPTFTPQFCILLQPLYYLYTFSTVLLINVPICTFAPRQNSSTKRWWTLRRERRMALWRDSLHLQVLSVHNPNRSVSEFTLTLLELM